MKEKFALLSFLLYNQNMRIDILTLFPNMFEPLFESVLGRAVSSGKLEINLVNIRDFSKDKHKKCDDVPFGGGAGMVMTAQPIYDAIKSVLTEDSTVIFLSPKGEVFSQEKAISLSKEKHLILLCGHYEGIDERIIEIFNPLQISIGDYVLTGGEIPAMVVVDAVARHVSTGRWSASRRGYSARWGTIIENASRVDTWISGFTKTRFHPASVRLTGSRRSPIPVANAGLHLLKNGQSAPNLARRYSISSSFIPKSYCVLSRRIMKAASLLPPPSPAPAGIRLCSHISTGGI